MVVVDVTSVKEAMRNMRYSIDQYKNLNNENKIIHLRNAITTGRSVTFILQNLKNDVGKQEFAIWYKKWQDKMSADKILVLFKDLRNEIEKQGKLDSSLYIKEAKFNMSEFDFTNGPENVVSFFVMDEYGGSGWDVEYPDGTKEKIYADLSSISKINIDFILDKAISRGILLDTSEMLDYYYDFLTRIINDFVRNFNKNKE